MTEKELRAKLVSTAQKYLGCKESDGSHKKIIDLYNGGKPPNYYKMTYSDAWCACFGSAVAMEAGLTDIIPIEVSCNRQIELFKKLGSWQESDAYVPSPGDYIFYDWQDSGAGDNTGSADHVGIVVSCDGKTIKVIEGNMSDAVGYRNIAVNGKFIRGFGAPKYGSKASTPTGGTTVAKLTPNAVYSMNGVTINEKIIPDGTRWTNATKAVNAGFSAGSLYKKQQKLSGGTGKVQSVTIHNTGDLPNVYDDGEQYTRATYNENMNSSRVHFYVDDTGAWQNLKAGTGLCAADPVGSAEVAWHSGDGSVATGGNMTSLSMEIIMGESADHDKIARDNGARIAAWLLWKNGLTVNALVTHTYWVNKSAGKTFSDVDEQCCNMVSGKKWCPSYIFGSTNKATAMKNWKDFKALVKSYLDKLLAGGSAAATTPAPTPAPAQTTVGAYLVRITATDLNIRTGPGTDNPSKGYIKPGTYTIVAESAGKGATKWGKLKSGAGWVALDYCKKV